MGLQVILATEAVRDLEKIHDHIALDSPVSASRIIGELLDSLDRLADFPRMGRHQPDEGAGEWRILNLKDYRILYVIHADWIHVLGVIQTRRLMPER